MGLYTFLALTRFFFYFKNLKEKRSNASKSAFSVIDPYFLYRFLSPPPLYTRWLFAVPPTVAALKKTRVLLSAENRAAEHVGRGMFRQRVGRAVPEKSENPT